MYVLVQKEKETLAGLPLFEGSEKLFEIWFIPPPQWEKTSPDGKTKLGLRNIPRSVWDHILALVKCKILNVLSNDYCDAYLLSESSMFVWNSKLILKTCGTTTLLCAVPKLLEIAGKMASLHEVSNVFYSRKRYLFPSQQQTLHSFFNNEVDFLDSIFSNGSAYILGKLNGEHWNLYLTETKEQKLKIIIDEENNESKNNKNNNNNNNKIDMKSRPDRTLEILMNDLDQEKMKSFFKSEEIKDAKDSELKSGIGKFFPDAVLDGFLFDPCGYSVNALLGKYYFTIHVTPQAECSYVSFETNIPLDSYEDLIQQVILAFNPGHFIISFFSTEDIEIMHKKIARWENDNSGYIRGARTTYQFESYNLLFVSQWQSSKPSKNIGTPSPQLKRESLSAKTV